MSDITTERSGTILRVQLNRPGQEKRDDVGCRSMRNELPSSGW